MRVSRPTAIQSRPCTGTRPPGKRPAALRSARPAARPTARTARIGPSRYARRSRRCRPRVPPGPGPSPGRTSASCASRSLRAVMVLAVRRSSRAPSSASSAASSRRASRPAMRGAVDRIGGAHRRDHAQFLVRGELVDRHRVLAPEHAQVHGFAQPPPQRLDEGARGGDHVGMRRGRQPHQRLAQADAGGRGGGQLLRFQRRDDAVHGGARQVRLLRDLAQALAAVVFGQRAQRRGGARNHLASRRGVVVFAHFPIPFLLACLDSPGANHDNSIRLMEQTSIVRNTNREHTRWPAEFIRPGKPYAARRGHAHHHGGLRDRPGLPAVAAQLGVGSGGSWLVTLPALGVVLFGPAAARLMERAGLRRALMLGLFLYGLLGAAGPYLRGIWLIYADRLLLGGATALVMAAGTGLISTFYTGRARGDDRAPGHGHRVGRRAVPVRRRPAGATALEPAVRAVPVRLGAAGAGSFLRARHSGRGAAFAASTAAPASATPTVSSTPVTAARPPPLPPCRCRSRPPSPPPCCRWSRSSPASSCCPPGSRAGRR